MLDTDVSVSRRRVLGSLGAGAVALGGLPVVHHGSIDGTPLVVGHRGVAGLEAPNTVAGIERAAEIGAHGVSLDVRLTADDELVLFHDPFLDIATTGHGLVEETTLSEIRNLEVDGEPIPTLREGLAALDGTGLLLFLELKKVGYGARVLDVVDESGLLDRTVVTSFKRPALAEVGAPTVTRGTIGSVPEPGLLDDAVASDSSYVMSHYTPYGLTWLVGEARDRNLRVGVWELVSTETHIEDALSFDIDVLTTNRPDIALEKMEG